MRGWALGYLETSRADGFAATLAGADPNAVFERQHEDFAVTDCSGVACPGGMDNRLHGGFNERLIHGNLELDFWKETNLDFRAAIHFGVTALPSTTTDVANRHKVDIAFRQSILDSFEFFGADDGNNEFHGLCRHLGSFYFFAYVLCEKGGETFGKIFGITAAAAEFSSPYCGHIGINGKEVGIGRFFRGLA